MTQPGDALITPAPWDTLRRFTDARIALGRAGHSLPTAAHLAFQLAHAQARDAVHLPLDVVGVTRSLGTAGLPVLQLHSAAADRQTYLQRPDLGRQLDTQSRQMLQDWQAGTAPVPRHDVAFVVADGLSALAVHANAAPLLHAVWALLRNDAAQHWSVAPVALVEQGRVAIGDEVGQWLQADAVVILIGERPGLSAPDSLGIYLSWNPRPGLHDAQRNCISNIRQAGLSIEAAAAKLHYLLSRARSLQITGIGLKDETVNVNSAASLPGKPATQASASLWRE
jgi:ethanolamine ammonia-lyase small subunit